MGSVVRLPEWAKAPGMEWTPGELEEWFGDDQDDFEDEGDYDE
jgi:hypothetical protein